MERLLLTVNFYTMKMELGEHLLVFDQIVKELERVDRPMDPKGIDTVILSGLTPQFNAEVRMLKNSSDWPTREWVEGTVINQNERLQSEESAAGNEALLAGRENGRNPKLSPPRFSFCSRTGHVSKGYRDYIVTKREQRPNGHERSSGKNEGHGSHKR